VALLALFVGWSSVSFAQSSTNNIFYQTFYGSWGNTNPANASQVVDLLGNIGGFLMIAGGIIAGIALIVSGLMYMAAGSNQTRVTSAKSIFKNGVIGALIIFGFGIIINTVMLLGTDPFGFFN